MRAHLEKWRQLCDDAVTEQDATRFAALIEEMNAMLHVKQERLNDEGLRDETEASKRDQKPEPLKTA